MMRANCLAMTIWASISLTSTVDGQLKRKKPYIPLKELAEDLGKKIGDKLAPLAPKQKNKRLTVAVFLPSGADKKYDVSLGNSPRQLQAALSDALRSELSSRAKGKFLVHYPAQVRKRIRDQVENGVSPEGLNDANVEVARTLLTVYGYDVGIVTAFDIAKLPTKKFEVRVNPKVITSKQTIPVAGRINSNVLNVNSPLVNNNLYDSKANANRFQVRISVLANEKPEKWATLPHYRLTGNKLAYLVKIPRKKYEGARFKIELINKAKPYLKKGFVRVVNPNDRDRLFAVAVTVDGVSVFLKERKLPGGDVAYLPDSRPHEQLSKRVLTGPGKRIVVAKGRSGPRLKGGRFVAAPRNADGSETEILGFQQDNEVAEAFRFGEPANSPGAEFVGATKEIGLITAYFYAERMQGDQFTMKGKVVKMVGPNVGAIRGERVRSELFPVVVRGGYYDEPVAIVHLIYRYDNDPKLPPHEKQPFIK